MFGSTGRFSQDIDLDATSVQSYEDEIDSALDAHRPYCGIAFEIDSFRHSGDGNFSGTIACNHDGGQGHFELQISYRLNPILEPRQLALVPQTYFKHVECGVPTLFGLDPYEMIGEKLMAMNEHASDQGRIAFGTKPQLPACIERSRHRGEIVGCSPQSLRAHSGNRTPVSVHISTTVPRRASDES